MARPTTSGELAVLNSLGRYPHTRILLEDPDGALQEMTALAGQDWVDGFSFSANVDDPIGGGRIQLRREINGTSLAPLIEGSPINRDSTSLYAPFTSPARAFQILVALLESGQVPDGGTDWKVLTDGLTDDMQMGGKAPRMTLNVRDPMSRLHHHIIKNVSTYGSDSSPVPVATVMQNILDTEFGAGEFPIRVVGTPGFNITQYDLGHVSTLEALIALRDFIGWNLHWKQNPSTGSFQITFYEPARSSSTPDHIIGPDDYYNISDFRFDTTRIRNSGEVLYTDTSGVEHSVTGDRPGSIALYEERFIRFDERDGQIRTQASALNLLNAALDDLSAPPAVQTIECAFWWPIELGDVVQFQPNGILYDTTQTWAVWGYEHVLRDRKPRTLIHARGKASGGFERWHRRAALLDRRPPRPQITSIVDRFDAGGHLFARVTAQNAFSVRLAADTTAFPDNAAVDAETAEPLTPAGTTEIDTGLVLASGESAFLSAKAYSRADGTGVVSKLTQERVTFSGGTADRAGVPTIRELVRQVGSTGFLEIVVNDPELRVTDVLFKVHSGAGDVDLSDPTDATWTSDATAPFEAQVALVAGHTSVIGWAVEYTDFNSNTVYIQGAHTFDLNRTANVQNIALSFGATGNIVVSASGDEDVANIYVTAQQGTPPPDPTAVANDGVINGREGVVDTGITCALGAVAHVKVVGENASGALGPVFSAQLRRGVGQKLPFTWALDPEQTGSTGEFRLTLTDQTLAITAVEYQVRQGAGPYGGTWLSAWDTSTGIAGTDVNLFRQLDVALAHKHTSSVKSRISYVDEDGQPAEIIIAHTFDMDRVAEVIGVTITLNSNQAPVITAHGDEDVRDNGTDPSFFVTVGIDAVPPDPTASVNDGVITLNGTRSGTVTATAVVPPGSTAHVKVVAVNDQGEFGPVAGPFLFRAPTVPTWTDIYSVSNAAPATLLGADGNPIELGTYSVDLRNIESGLSETSSWVLTVTSGGSSFLLIGQDSHPDEGNDDPELFLDAGVPKVRLNGGTNTHDVLARVEVGGGLSQAAERALVPTVQEQVRQVGSTGFLAITVNDPESRVTRILFKAQQGPGDIDLSDPTDLSWTEDPGPLFEASVALVAKHTSVIGYAVGYLDADNAEVFIQGAHTFDLDRIAEVQNIALSFGSDGDVVLSAIGDEDTANLYVTAAQGSPPANPTAAANDGTISGRAGVVDTGVHIDLGTVAHVKVVAADTSGALGPVQSARLRRGVAAHLPFTYDLDPEQVGSTGQYRLTVTDPTRSITAVQFQTRQGAGAYNGTWLSSWDTSTGTAGADTVLFRQENIALSTKHTSSIKARVSYTDEDGIARVLVVPHTFDLDRVAEVIGVQVTFDVTEHVVISVSGDEDVRDNGTNASFYVTVGVGTDPPDPTASVNDGVIVLPNGARSGTVTTTTVQVFPGETAHVKVVAVNDQGEFGPVAGPFRVLAPAAQRVFPRVAERISQSGNTGVLQLVIDDPDDTVTGVFFKSHSGAGDVDLSDPTDATWTQDPGPVFQDTVALVAKHTSVIGWAVRYENADAVTAFIQGAHTFDLDRVAEVQNIAISFDATGDIVVSASGDEDTANMFVSAAQDANPPNPTAASNDGTISGRDGVVNTGIHCDLGSNANVEVVAEDANNALGPVRSARLRRGVGAKLPFTWELDPEQVGSTGQFRLSVTDPTRALTAIQYQTREGAGAYGGTWLSAWDTSTGTPGTASNLVRQKNIALSTKHTSSVKARFSYTDSDGDPRTIVVEHTFDLDRVAEVTGVQTTFGAASEVIISANGDEDVRDNGTNASFYVTVGNQVDPPDPTAAINDGVIVLDGTRSGRVTTSVIVPSGNTAHVKVVAVNDQGELGPIAGPFLTRAPEFSSWTRTYSVSNAAPKNLLSVDGLPITAVGNDLFVELKNIESGDNEQSTWTVTQVGSNMLIIGSVAHPDEGPDDPELFVGVAQVGGVPTNVLRIRLSGGSNTHDVLATVTPTIPVGGSITLVAPGGGSSRPFLGLSVQAGGGGVSSIESGVIGGGTAVPLDLLAGSSRLTLNLGGDINGNNRLVIGDDVPVPGHLSEDLPGKIFGKFATTASNKHTVVGFFYGEQRAANNASIQGVEGYARTTHPSGNVTTSFGTIGNVEHDGDGNIGQVRCLHTGFIFGPNAGGTIQQVRQVNVGGAAKVGSAEGTIVNHYGIYISPRGIGNNRWAIFQDGGDDPTRLTGALTVRNDRGGGTNAIIVDARTNGTPALVAALHNGDLRWRWGHTSQSDGADWSLFRYNDNGGFLATAIYVRRTNGQVGIDTINPTNKLHVTGTVRVDVAGGGATAIRTNSTNNSTPALVSAEHNGNLRWRWGHNSQGSGADWQLYRYNDSGDFLGAAISVNRFGGGEVTLESPPQVIGRGAVAFADEVLATTGATMTGTLVFHDVGDIDNIRLDDVEGQASLIAFEENGTVHWRMGREGGGNDDWVLFRYNDAGVFQDTPLRIEHSNGRVFAANRIVAPQLEATASGTTSSGTPPFVVSSSTLVDSLNADLLDGHHEGFYRDADNLNAGTVPSARITGAYNNISSIGQLDDLIVSPGALLVRNNRGGGTNTMIMDALTSGTPALMAATHNGSLRWRWGHTGQGSGADWVLFRYNNSGDFLGTPITVDRFGNGEVTFETRPTVNGDGLALQSETIGSGGATLNGPLILHDTGATSPLQLDDQPGQASLIAFEENGTVHWRMGRAGGGNDDFVLFRYGDGGAFLDTPLRVERSNGRIFADNRIVAPQLEATASGTTSSGTPPFVVSSSTRVDGLNVDLLEGHHGSFYRDADNLNAGTIGSARVTGNYSGITGVGQLDDLTVNPGPIKVRNNRGGGTNSFIMESANNSTPALMAAMHNGSLRWRWGHNSQGSGADWVLFRYNSNGVFLGMPIKVDRFGSGEVTFETRPTVNGAGLALSSETISSGGATMTGALIFHDTGVLSPIQLDDQPGQASLIAFEENGTVHWRMGRAGGGNDDWVLFRYGDGGGFLDTPIRVERSNGRVFAANRIVAPQLEATASGTTSSGTPPFVVASSTLVDGLNADLLDGHHEGFYRDADNLNAGRVPSGRITGAYNNISSVGTLDDLRVSGAVRIDRSGGGLTGLRVNAQTNSTPALVSAEHQGDLRWRWGHNSQGSGADWVLFRYNNSGGFLGRSIAVDRGTGDATFEGSVTENSSAELKADVQPFDDDPLAMIEPIAFHRFRKLADGSGRGRIGIIAEDAAAVAPWLTGRCGDVFDIGAAAAVGLAGVQALNRELRRWRAALEGASDLDDLKRRIRLEA